MQLGVCISCFWWYIIPQELEISQHSGRRFCPHQQPFYADLFWAGEPVFTGRVYVHDFNSSALFLRLEMRGKR